MKLIIATTTKERHRSSPSQTGKGAFEEHKGTVRWKCKMLPKEMATGGTRKMGQCKCGEGGMWGGTDSTACRADMPREHPGPPE